MITIKKLGFSYGNNVVLKDISMELQEGRIYGLLGENGVGKTTLLTLLSGLKEPQSGAILVDGMTPFDRTTSFLTSVYYLPDEVPAARMSANAFAAYRGQFWDNFDLDKYREIMDVLENDGNMRMDQMSSVLHWLATPGIYSWMSLQTVLTFLPSHSSARRSPNTHPMNPPFLSPHIRYVTLRLSSIR